MAKIFITRPIPEPALELLIDAGHSVVVGKRQEGLTKKALIKELKNGSYDAILSSLTDSIDTEVIDSFGGKIIANHAVGFNNIDVEYARSKNIFVTNTPTSSDAVAEFAAALTICLERKLFSADAFVRRGLFRGFDSNIFLGHDMHGKVLGIIGTGRIGGMFARIMSLGFRMSIVYTDVVRNERIEKECNARFVEMDELLEFSDIVSIHVPLTPKTRHLIGEKEFALMRQNALLINTSRGPVVDEEALVNAIKSGKIAGAALDVYEFEPKVSRALTKLPNVILTPHIASATVESRRAMSRIAAENILQALRGETPHSLVS